MDSLLIKSKKKIQSVPIRFMRSLLNEINFSNRIIAIKGARGSGKTTLLLQYAKLYLDNTDSVLYVAMDDLFFQGTNLYDLADSFYINNGKYLLLDEVHKYPGWSREIKLIYDDFPGLFVVFTSSSVLNIYRSESDLSRRVVSYFLPELSLIEFIKFESQIDLPKFRLDEIINDHEEITSRNCHKCTLYTKY